MINEREAQLQQIEISLEDAQANVALAEKLSRLHKNKDFQELIVEGYFRDEASRAVLLKADPEMCEDREQKQLNDIITSIGGLRQYFHKVFRLGQMSEQSMEADKQTRQELLAEDLTTVEGSGEVLQ